MNMTHDFDLRVIYTWQEGSLPPPYYHEFEIHMGPGNEAKITFLPDYSFNNPPVWEHTIQVPETQKTDFINLINDLRIFSTDWASKKMPSVGGAQDTLEIELDDRKVRISGQFEPDQSKVAEKLYCQVRNLIPKQVWRDLESRKREYEMNFPNWAP